MSVETLGCSRKDIEDAINFCNYRIVDLLDEIEILRNRRRLLKQKQTEMVEFEQLTIKKSLEKMEVKKK